ncbi:MAG: Asp-tRNA(Asn)/Glu-tRNA(Gln) amidotransferase subunit GatB [Patescibacteria group bacterium]
MSKLIPVIGMEVHTELKTASKMFCRCPNGAGLDVPANTNVCPVCLAHPGALPVANREAIKLVVKVGLAISGKIASVSKFDRKNYFYPDLPKGYQISQYDQPLVAGGTLSANDRDIAITRIHLEEDTGKLQHPTGANYSYVDFNRASVPLMELVTEPAVRSSTEAKRFCQELQLLLRTLDVSDADMEKGQMRCEANISLMAETKEWKPENFGTKVEVKNLNSFRAVERAIEFEIKRQTEVLNSGGTVLQETRGWDDAGQKTYSQRTKESAHDYRYFPDPDLTPITLFDEGEIAIADGIDVAALRRTLPELPQAKRHRFMADLGLSAEDALLLSSDAELALFVETVAVSIRSWLPTLDDVSGTEEEIWAGAKAKVGKLVGGWMTSELFKLLREHNLTLKTAKLTPGQFTDFLKLIYLRRVNSSAGQVILSEMVLTGSDPETILAEKDLSQTNDTASLDQTVQSVINANEGPANEYKNGKDNVLQFLVGQGMKASKGKANPEALAERIQKALRG